MKAVRFLAALLRHIKRGKGCLPKEEIVKRLEICESCDKFNGRVCELCGCCVEGKRNLFNKLAYPLESCPLGKWGPNDSDIHRP